MPSEGHGFDDRSLFNAFMDNNPAICFVFDADGLLVYINSEGLTRFGWKLEDALLHKASAILSKAAAEEIEAENRYVLETGKRLNITKVIPTPDETGMVWQVTKFLLVDHLGLRYVGGIAVDVTELDSKKRQLEELNKNLALQKQSLVEANLVQRKSLLSLQKQIPMGGE